MVLCMSSMILGGCIPSPKKQTEAITVEENPNMMYMLVGSYATPEEEGIKVYNFEVQDFHTYFVGECGVLVHNDCNTGKYKELRGEEGKEYML